MLVIPYNSRTKRVEVDWDNVPEWANYAATDSNDEVWVYEHQPSIGERSWGRVSQGRTWLYMASYLGCVNLGWKDSLIERPAIRGGIEMNEDDKINWAAGDIPEWANYAATDDTGAVYVYADMPKIGDGAWHNILESDYAYYGSDPSTTRIENWRDSLQTRPNMQTLTVEEVRHLLTIRLSHPHIPIDDLIKYRSDTEYLEYIRLKRKYE